MGEVSGRNPIRRSAIVAAVLAVLAGVGWTIATLWGGRGEKLVRIVVPGRLVRGAWQDPAALRTLIERERIRTIVTLTAINRDDPKYVGQAAVVNRTGVDWVIVPMRGSTASLAEMACAADLLADPARQPVFFHCVAGHHRTSLAHAAYLVRHAGLTADQAWQAIAGFPWTRPQAPADQKDRALIADFARLQSSFPRAPTDRKR